MSDAYAQSHANERQLRYEWERAQAGWRDSTAAYFETHFLAAIEDALDDYARALADLSEVLQAANAAARD